jgi:hypothetical protein
VTNDPFMWFWLAMIGFSIAWYSFLLFWLGIRGGREIVRMARVLGARPAPPTPRTTPRE